MQTRPQYLFHAVDFHVRVRVHPAVPVASHCGAALFDGPVAAVAHETDDGYDHGQHGSGQGVVANAMCQWSGRDMKRDGEKDDVVLLLFRQELSYSDGRS